jgi:hypothetical protein
MVPPALPEPALLVTITGVLELAGAAGLLSRRTAPWAAAGLSALLVAMFPANVCAAVEGLTLCGDPAMGPKSPEPCCSCSSWLQRSPCWHTTCAIADG